MNILQYITTNSDTIDNNPQGYLDMVHSVLSAEFAKNEENLTACKKNYFTSLANKVYAILAFAKSEAERRNSNNKTLANTSTPLIRAFFVRSTRTPKESAFLKTEERSILQYELGMSKFGHSLFFSMVACNGKGSPFAVFQSSQFSTPLHAIARIVENSAVVFNNLTLELSAMIYLFKAVSRLDLRNTSKPISSFPCYTVRIKANSLEQAKAKVCPFFAVKEVVYA
ncbi:ash family protein [Actinobacillus capsulatus]|uniref:ash family protein n=2 Tax=Actinobacillus TaxID=713 RepID=UPI000378E1EB|nr:ash family protein [Actinobacillus capsulatus]